MMKILRLLALAWASMVHAEVIPVAPLETCFLCSTAPSMTMYWPGKNAQAVLIFIPGGEGYIGLKEGQTDHRYHFYQALKRLTNPALTRGKLDVVLLDSPAELSPRQPYPAARGASDHMIRIESVIRYYQQKTGLPVWLMGHSNGGISLTEFFKYAKKNQRTDLIAGFIASGIRSESYFEAPMSFPMLFMHHARDGCAHTLPASAYANYTLVKAFNTAPTQFVYIQGGEAEPKDACRSGHHMYFGAGDEMAQGVDAFIAQFDK